jgi:hypothetical protein
MDFLGSLTVRGVADAFILLAALLLNVILSYFMALFMSVTFKKIMVVREIEEFLIRYGAMTSKLWHQTAGFITQYLKWYLTFIIAVIGFDMVLNLMTSPAIALRLGEVAFIDWVSDLLNGILWFIILTVAGLIAGGIVFKLVKEVMLGFGVEEKLSRHGLEGSFGGLNLSNILSGIAKWYIVLLFMNEGIQKLRLQVLSNFITSLVDYIPDAIVGVLIVLISLMISRFTADRVRARKLAGSEHLAFAVELMIVFFGVVLALPVLVAGIDVSILTDSFKLLVAGFSLAFAIAFGLGLKDVVSEKARKI